MARPSTVEFLKTEAGAGAVLALAVVAAMAAANSPWAGVYFAFAGEPIPVRIGAFDQVRSVLGWAREGLMAAFFLILGMQLKYEVLRGEFASPRRLALPLIAAAGGVAGPALVYLALDAGGAARGWPIPIATDLAAALAVLAAFGRRAPPSLRLFVMTLAVADNLAAVAASSLPDLREVHPAAFAGAAVSLAALAALSRWRGAPRLFHAAGIGLVWAFALQAGVCTAVAALACALTVPIAPRRADQESVLKTFTSGLHPYVAWGVLPLFAFVAAGASLGGVGPADLDPTGTPAGVALGLLVGKPAGIIGFSALAVAVGLARRPVGVGWLDLTAAALLCGVGMTMGLWVAGQTPSAAESLDQGGVRLAVLLGSLLSAALGALILLRRRENPIETY